MSAQRDACVRRLAAPDITARKRGQPIVCLTAYTTPVAAILDGVCDLLLVGDSVGMVLHGLPNTVGVTHEMMCKNLRAYIQRLFELVGAKGVTVTHVKCKTRGDEHCEYAVRWA